MRIRKTQNPKKCFVCSKSFYGHYNQIYCGNRNIKDSGCAYTRNVNRWKERYLKWYGSEDYRVWLKKYISTDLFKEKNRKASQLNREKNKTVIK
jgi:hypothetical protein